MMFIDSYTVILKARAISERIIRNIFVSEGIVETSDMNQKERIILLQEQRIFSEEIAKMFHTLRFFGNRAIHAIITEEGINDEDELLILCQKKGWRTDWYNKFKHYFQLS